jgi:hypothetical protein
MKLKRGDKVKCIDCSPWGTDKLSPTIIYTIEDVDYDMACVIINDKYGKRWSIGRFKYINPRKQKLPLP